MRQSTNSEAKVAEVAQLCWPGLGEARGTGETPLERGAQRSETWGVSWRGVLTRSE